MLYKVLVTLGLLVLMALPASAQEDRIIKIIPSHAMSISFNGQPVDTSQNNTQDNTQDNKDLPENALVFSIIKSPTGLSLLESSQVIQDVNDVDLSVMHYINRKENQPWPY